MRQNGKRLLFKGMGVEYYFALHRSYRDFEGTVVEMGELTNSRGGSTYALLIDGQVKQEDTNLKTITNMFLSVTDQ